MIYGRRYFILEGPLQATAIKTLLGRVVVYPTLPLEHYAPLKPRNPNQRSHNPEDIIPDLLPAPSLSATRSDVLSASKSASVHLALTGIFGLDLARSTEDRLSLESEQVRRYALENPPHLFDRLMEHDDYAADVAQLFGQVRRSRLYLVTGFLTTKGTNWTRRHAQASEAGFEATAPISELSGMALPGGIGDPSMAPRFQREKEGETAMTVAEEEIFAVCYSVVKTSHRFDRDEKLLVKKVYIAGPPHRATAKQLALGSDREKDKNVAANPDDLSDADFFLADNDVLDESDSPDVPRMFTL